MATDMAKENRIVGLIALDFHRYKAKIQTVSF
jgi:hypothetical protein